MTPNELMDLYLRGTDTYKYRYDTSRYRVLHIEGKKWALIWYRGGSYSCNGFNNYVSGGIDLVQGFDKPQTRFDRLDRKIVWDTARKANGTFKPDLLPWLIATVKQFKCDGWAVRDAVNNRPRPTGKRAKRSGKEYPPVTRDQILALLSDWITAREVGEQLWPHLRGQGSMNGGPSSCAVAATFQLSKLCKSKLVMKDRPNKGGPTVYKRIYG